LCNLSGLENAHWQRLGTSHICKGKALLGLVARIKADRLALNRQKARIK
jgi:hypothetical protein